MNNETILDLLQEENFELALIEEKCLETAVTTSSYEKTSNI